VPGSPQPESVETDLGPVELIRAGSGPAVLFVHGTPGGSDSSLAMGRFLVEAGFELIAPSRPGYLGTPLGERKTIDDQADLHAATLGALAIERVAVVAWSGGGPSAYRLSVRHPERVRALVPFACVSERYPEPKESLDERLMMKTSMGNWMLRFLAAHAPKSTVEATLKAEGDLTKEELAGLVKQTMGDDASLDVVLTMANVCGDYSHREQGVTNDWRQFGAMDSLELEKIAAPTLVIWGDADIDVPPAHSEHAAGTIPGAEAVVLDHGTHLALFAHAEARWTQERVVELLRTRIGS
jgi:pimeloyl-ACP methyl ester carboxylesterase